MNKVHPRPERTRKRKKKQTRVLSDSEEEEEEEHSFDSVLVNNYVSREDLALEGTGTVTGLTSKEQEGSPPQLVFRAEVRMGVEDAGDSGDLAVNKAALAAREQEEERVVRESEERVREILAREEREEQERREREERVVREKLEEEEARLRELVAESTHVLENRSADRSSDEARIEDVEHTWVEEERKLEELVAQNQTILSNPLVKDEDEEVRVDEGHHAVVEATLQEEEFHNKTLRKVLRRQSTLAELEAAAHRGLAEEEEATLRARAERSEALRRQQSRAVLEGAGVRKNLAERPEHTKGKVVHTTDRGMLKFSTNEDFSYTPGKCRHLAPDSVQLAQRGKRHLQTPDCDYTRNTGTWSIPREAVYANTTASVVNPRGLTDGTGTSHHSGSNGGCVMVNRARKHDIPVAGSMGEGRALHLIPTEPHLLNIAQHYLSTTGSLQDTTRGHFICREGVRVQRACAYTIPLPATTELRNRCAHDIPPSNSLLNRSKGLDLYTDTDYSHAVVGTCIPMEGNLVQRGMKYTIPAEGDQDENNPAFNIPPGGDQDSNNPAYSIPESGSLVGGVRGALIPGPGQLVHRARHLHHRYKNWSPWKRAKFSVPSEGTLVNEGRFSVFTDASWSDREGDFEINDVSIDEEYLIEE